MLLFVYGTLKRGHGNNALLRGTAEFLGNATTVKPYPFFAHGLPVVYDVLDGNALRIKGELYRFFDERNIERVDRLEGHPHWYTRKIIKVRTNADHKIYDAWCYMQDSQAYDQVRFSGRTKYVSCYEDAYS
jgi:gamma-glutamylcyclotransferase (GGCT)/AIG2-like uncharacterized protein YtfP